MPATEIIPIGEVSYFKKSNDSSLISKPKNRKILNNHYFIDKGNIVFKYLFTNTGS
jgi:hypothetical protein